MIYLLALCSAILVCCLVLPCSAILDRQVVLKTSGVLVAIGKDDVVDFGKDDCRCIGLDGVEGTTTLNFTSEGTTATVDFPADLGAHCKDWDNTDKGHPLCPGAPWCKEKFCFVDPCNCKNIDVLPKPSGWMAGSKYQGKPVYFSYVTCGGKDSYTSDADKKNTEASIKTTCSAAVDSAKWGSEDCRCVGIGPQAGITKATINGQKMDYPADVGSTCHTWDESDTLNCQGESPPGWCSQAWCVVDPDACEAKYLPKLTAFLQDATYQGRSLYFSYGTCEEFVEVPGWEVLVSVPGDIESKDPLLADWPEDAEVVKEVVEETPK